MCVCVCVCVCVYACVCVCTCVRVHTYVHAYVCVWDQMWCIQTIEGFSQPGHQCSCIQQTGYTKLKGRVGESEGMGSVETEEQ